MEAIPVSFGIPELAYAALATPVVLALVFAIDFTRRRRALEKIGKSAMLSRMLETLSVRRRVLKAVLFSFGMTGLAVAVARPQVEGESSWQQRGIDVVVIVDFSRSMLAEDVYPNRFDRSLVELDGLLDELEANRIAVVAVAGETSYFPLTHDLETVRGFLSGIGPRDMPPGSNLGKGVAVARCILFPENVDTDDCRAVGQRANGGAPIGDDETLAKSAKAAPPTDDRARALVLFTDGGDTHGDLVDQIGRAAEQGIHSYVVGVGTEAGELIPTYDDAGRRTGWQRKPGSDGYVTTRLEAERLQDAMEVAGELGELFWLRGKTFRRGDLVAKLQTLKKGNLDQRVVHKRVEVYYWFLFPALLLLIIEACIGERRRRRQ
jgi:Ca-activated chloride channel family protein